MKQLDDSFATWPASPLANSYWVEPGRLLAGEYPGALSRSETAARLRSLLDAGITSFIDLTGEGELPPYGPELAGLAAGIAHRRFRILDHGVPHSPDTMIGIVTALDADLAAGRRVYLHCRAGIGRTGMAVACYLIHRGLENEQALERLQSLWQRSARARSWPAVPETEEQVRYVRDWIAPFGERSRQRIEGALLGLAIGEAFAGRREPIDAARLGGPVETLITGADTAMTLAVAESLLAFGTHDAADQLQRYVAWSQSADARERMPAELKRVLALYQWSRKPNPGSHDPSNLDPHSLARTLAVALYSRHAAEEAAELAAEVSRTTLQSPVVLDICRLWAVTLVAALNGASKAELLSLHAAQQVLQHRPVKPQVTALLKGHWERTDQSDALAVVTSALEAFRRVVSFEDAIREAMRESTTCGALIGSLAGAHYGSRSIPREWLDALPESQALADVARRLGS